MLINYLKLTYKVLLRRKFFTAVSLFAISFTLVVLVVGSALLDHLFGPHHPDIYADRSVGVYGVTASKSFPDGGMMTTNGFGGYYFLDQQVRTLEGADIITLSSTTASTYSYHRGSKIKIYKKYVDSNFWKVFDITLKQGRLLNEDDEKNQNPVAVINESTAKVFFGNESALNQIIEFDGLRLTVVGITENIPFLRQIPFSDVWVPISLVPNINLNRDLTGDFIATIVAKNESDIPGIQKQLDDKIKSYQFPDGKFDTIVTKAETLFDYISRTLFDDRSTSSKSAGLLGLLILIAVLFMLLPTINLININVSRIYERSSEIGVRKAFGASSFQLVKQFLIENIVITFLGGIIGFILSAVILEFINSTNWILYSDFSINYRIFIYGFLMTLFLGLISGVYPAWKMSRMNPVDALKGTR